MGGHDPVLVCCTCCLRLLEKKSYTCEKIEEYREGARKGKGTGWRKSVAYFSDLHRIGGERPGTVHKIQIAGSMR